MNEHLRQTGRTTRMLKEAAEYERRGLSVVVFVHDRRSAMQIRRLPGYTGPVEEVPDPFDWSAMRDPARPHLKCFVDHAAIERHLQTIDERILRLQQLARQLYHLTTN